MLAESTNDYWAQKWFFSPQLSEIHDHLNRFTEFPQAELFTFQDTYAIP
jgi:hypothetical protein